jgi:hypothetical protein
MCSRLAMSHGLGMLSRGNRATSFCLRRWTAEKATAAASNGVRLLSADAAVEEEKIVMPTGAGQNLVYPKKIVDIVDQIARLNLLEVSDLNALLKSRLNIRYVCRPPLLRGIHQSLLSLDS